MIEFEIFVCASYMVNEHEEQNCFKEYVNANNSSEAKRICRAGLKSEGYKNIEMDEPIEVR